jgi:fibronectin-binding autotransporter adhesin
MRSTHKKNTRAMGAIVAATASLIVASHASAVDYTWTALSGGSLDWNTAANWGGAGTPSLAGDTANLGVALTGNLNVGLSAPVTVGKITLGATGFTTTIGAAGGNAISLDNTGGTGNPGFTTVGTGTNAINAPLVLLGTPVEFAAASTSGLTLGGGLTTSGGQRTINNLSTQTLTINGPIYLSEVGTTTGRGIFINNGTTFGPVVLGGDISNQNGATPSGFGYGSVAALAIGQNSTTSVRSLVTIKGNNTYTGNTQINKVDLVLDTASTSTPLGTGRVILGGPSNTVSSRLSSTSDVTLNNPTAQWQQYTAFIGNNSFNFTGLTFASASRGIGNLLPAGKSVTLNQLYLANDSTARTQVIDGSGLTIINGTIGNAHNGTTELTGGLNGVEKRGTGVLRINGTANTYTGGTRVRGGVVEFAAIGGAGAGGVTVDGGGTVSLATGTTSSAFLALINTGSTGVSGPTPAPFVSTGALGLATPDAAVNLDFTSGDLANPNSTKMHVGAQLAGLTYTGTITPSDNTYRLGGGGDLTLPNANQLTGARNVSLNNGGKVVVTGSNNYTGVTTIGGVYMNPTQRIFEQAAQFNAVNLANIASATNPIALRASSTLTVGSIANGGVASGLGSASSAASNLVLNGGTLQVNGAGGTSDRGFTIQPNGATLDSSGTGAVSFNGAVVLADAAPRAGTIESTTNRVIRMDDVSDLSVGMTVTGTGLNTGLTIVAILPPSFQNIGGTAGAASPWQIITSATPAAAVAAVPDLTFGAQNRTLTLTGSNAGANAVGGALADSATGKLAVRKTGTGTWNLTGANTFTGGIAVDAGCLGVKKLGVNGNATVAAGATLQVGVGGTGPSDTSTTSLIGETTNTLTLAAGASLDVTKSGVVFDFTTTSPEANIRSLLTSGRNGGAWNGVGINSSAVASNPGSAVGYASAADAAGLGGTLLGQAFDATSVLVRYTRPGDSTLDGTVNFDDLLKLAANYNLTGGGTWAKGDYNYDNTVNFDDLLLLAANYNTSVTGSFGGDWALAQSAVPEPTTLATIAVAGAAMLGRRRRRA